MTAAAQILAEQVAHAEATLAEHEYSCELCPRQRPGLPPRKGTCTVDYWASVCEECAVWWLVRLQMEGRL